MLSELAASESKHPLTRDDLANKGILRLVRRISPAHLAQDDNKRRLLFVFDVHILSVDDAFVFLLARAIPCACSVRTWSRTASRSTTIT